MIRRARLLLSLTLVLAACGGTGGAGGDGTAELWVTRDRGAEVLLTATVPAGVTVVQALEAEAEVETRYGGRFVQSIDGIAGSLAGQRDWFYFLNGIEPDLGAAEVTLRAGDVVWWDYRSWKGVSQEQPVVVGAFPEPFLHGFAGKRRPVELRVPPELRPEADAMRELLGGGPAGRAPNVFVLEVKAGAAGATLSARRGAGNDSPVTFTLSGSLAAVRAAARALAEEPGIVRYRYEAAFDETGKVIR